MSEFTYKELIDEIPKLAAVNAANNAIIRNLEIKLKKAIEALEFYADKDNWLVRDCDADTIYYDDCDDSIAGHGGKRARQALKEIKGKL